MKPATYKILTAALIMVCAPVQLTSSPVPVQVATSYAQTFSTPIDLVARCSGCGCRGGPGWRSKRTGQCVGWKNLYSECGNPPSPDRCTKEN